MWTGCLSAQAWEYDRLYETACLEPMVYGEGVYTARVMTDYILTTIKKTRQSEQENVEEESVCGDIYPNPAQQIASIDYNSEKSSVLRVINLSGQEVAKYELQAGSYSFSFDVSSLPEGVYIYLLENNSSLIKYGKFVIIH
jgi:Secretion system C-terminal sorting domain